MPLVTQSQRLFTFTSPLGADVFAVTEFHGREELSRPFQFTLNLVSENADVRPADLIGLKVGWSVTFPTDTPRHFHGYVSRFSAGPNLNRKLRSYRIEVVPWLWFLTRTTDCRIFQEMTAPDIIEKVIKAAGIKPN